MYSFLCMSRCYFAWTEKDVIFEAINHFENDCIYGIGIHILFYSPAIFRPWRMVNFNTFQMQKMTSIFKSISFLIHGIKACIKRFSVKKLLNVFCGEQVQGDGMWWTKSLQGQQLPLNRNGYTRAQMIRTI